MRLIIVALFLTLSSKPALAGCIDNPRTCNKNLLCAYAEISYGDEFFWNTKKYPLHVEEAKRRGMSCRIKDENAVENIENNSATNKSKKVTDKSISTVKKPVKENKIISAENDEKYYKTLNPSKLDCKAIRDKTLTNPDKLRNIEEIDEVLTLSIAKMKCGQTSFLKETPQKYKHFFTSEINKTTDSFLKDKYTCMAALIPDIRPILQQDDLFKTSEAMLIDMTKDGKPEFIYSREGTYHYDDKDPDLSRKASQYLFYSKKPKINIPDNSKFMNARQMIVQDLNGDGQDDGIFIQHGPDYKPHKRHENKIMLSSSKGYTIKKLPGDKALYHGASAGDVDKDGDVDIIVSPGYKSRVYAYTNNGKGKFKTKYLTKERDHSLNVVKLWDIDGDGALDLVTNSKNKIQVFWGDGSFNYFNKKPTEIEATIKGTLAFASDFTFGNQKNIIFASITANYKKYEIKKLVIKDRKFVGSSSIGEGKEWIIFINSCDLQGDGDIDILNFGSGEMAWKIWVNTNKNKLSYLNIPLPNIYLYRDGMHEASLLVLEKLYEIFGISDKFYVPEQIYFQNPKYKSDSHYYLLDSDTNEFCKLFKTACVFSKKLRLFN